MLMFLKCNLKTGLVPPAMHGHALLLVSRLTPGAHCVLVSKGKKQSIAATVSTKIIVLTFPIHYNKFLGGCFLSPWPKCVPKFYNPGALIKPNITNQYSKRLSWFNKAIDLRRLTVEGAHGGLWITVLIRDSVGS